MSGQGVSRSESEIAQKSWPSGAPARAAAACSAEMPGQTRISTCRLQPAILRAFQQLESECCEPVDAGIARRDQRHIAARCGEVEGAAHAAFLLAERGLVLRLAGDRIGDEVEIEAVADDVAGVGRAPSRLRAMRQSRMPGPMPTIASVPRPRPTESGSMSRGLRAMAQVARADFGFGAMSLHRCQPRRALQLRRRRACRSRGARCPRASQAVALLACELGGGEEARGHVQTRRPMHAPPARRS